ncbi:MAG: Molybdenum transport system permease protein ModB [Myxococcaceae bacterium]|nr:Molybdenum transport system permease protein ModB [Myxococcaceae bacterium]
MSWAPILLSLEVASCATLLAGVLGIAIALLLARTRFCGKEWVDVLVTAPMVLPPTVLGYYLLTLLGRSSSLGRAFESVTGSSIAFSRTGAVIAATLAALPFVLKSARVAFEEIDPRLLAAAQTLGARPLRVLFQIELPLARAGIAAGLALGFARSLGEFGITLMLAGNLPGETQTSALAIYDAVQASRDQDATKLSLLMSLIAVSLLYLVNRLTKRKVHGF